MLYGLARIVFYLYYKLYHRIEIYGVDTLPSKRPLILAANHASYLDPPAIGMAFPDKLRFIAWEGLFSNFFMRVFITAMGAVPVSQENKGSAASLLRQVLGFLEEGFNVLIFPEGKRSEDGKLMPLEGGVALLSVRTMTPVIPVWIEGSHKAMSPSMSFPRPFKLKIFFGEAIDPSLFPEELTEKERRSLLLEKLNDALSEMQEKQNKLTF